MARNGAHFSCELHLLQALHVKVKMKTIFVFLSVFVVANAVSLRLTRNRASQGLSSPRWCKGRECPSFRVLERTGDYELREYDASAWVSTNILNVDHRQAMRMQFMKLFNYISGANSRQEKIDMTVPVRTRIVPGQDDYTMSFFISPQVGNPPQPTDTSVSIEQMPEKFAVYVSQFGGYYRRLDSWNQKAMELATALNNGGLSYETGYYYINGYNSPWTFFNRHNEVWMVKK